MWWRDYEKALLFLTLQILTHPPIFLTNSKIILGVDSANARQLTLWHCLLLAGPIPRKIFTIILGTWTQSKIDSVSKCCLKTTSQSVLGPYTEWSLHCCHSVTHCTWSQWCCWNAMVSRASNKWPIHLPNRKLTSHWCQAYG